MQPLCRWPRTPLCLLKQRDAVRPVLSIGPQWSLPAHHPCHWLSDSPAWCGRWVWLSLLLLAAVWVLMLRFGGGYYNLIEQAATQAIAARGTANESAALREYHRARLAWHPIAMTAVGFIGLGAILWLMNFKPF